MKRFILLFTLLLSFTVFAQKPKVDIVRWKPMSTAIRDTITLQPGDRWEIYNTTTDQKEIWNGTAWVSAQGSGGLTNPLTEDLIVNGFDIVANNGLDNINLTSSAGISYNTQAQGHTFNTGGYAAATFNNSGAGVASNITFGTNNFSPAHISLYGGDSMGENTILRMYNNTEEDTNILNYSFETFNGNLIFKANGGTNGSSTPVFTVNSSTLQVGFGNYEWPRQDGTAGQVPTTDGSGNVTWQDASSGSSTALETTYDNSNSNIPDTNVKEALDYLDSKTDFRGDLAIADTPATDGYYFANETGTYTNAGSVVTDLTQGLNIIIKEGVNYSLVIVPLNGLTADEQAVLDVTSNVDFNLFDASQIVNNGFWDVSSQSFLANASSGTFKIPVVAGETYIVKTISGVIKTYAFLDGSETLLSVENYLDLGQITIPTGCEFLSLTARFGAVAYDMIVTKSDYDNSEIVAQTYTSGLSGEFDNWRKFRETFKSDLKGKSIAPVPYFKDINLNDYIVPTAFWGNAITTDIAIKDAGHLNVTNETNVPIYGTGLRFTPLTTYGTTRKELAFKIDKDYLTSKGVANGDTIKFGHWVKAVQPLERNIRFEKNLTHTTGITAVSTSILVNEDWTWVEYPELTFDATLDVYSIANAYARGTGSALDAFIVTGLTIINTSQNTWFGYEENNEYALTQAVTDALSGGITPEIETVLQSNTTIRDLMNEQHYGAYITDFREQLRTMIDFWGKPASEIQIVFLADSILFGTNGVADKIADWLFATFGIPTANVNVDACWGGYSSPDYLRAVESSVIYPNADLVIISEAGGQAALEQMVKLIQSKSSADIVIGTWTKYTNDPVFETAGQYNQLRDMAHRYGCELWDINALLVRAIADGDAAQYYSGTLHLSADGKDFIANDFKKHLVNDRFYNEYNKGTSKREVIQFASDFNIPLEGVTYNGAWSGNAVANFLQSSTSGNYIEIPFTGTGIEVLFDTQSASHTILLDGAAPSAYVSSGRYLEYCTQIVGKTQTDPNWQFHRFFKAEVTAPFLTNSEDSLEFEIEIDAITRSGSDITSLAYTLRVNDGGWTSLGTGNINTDSTFTLRTTGQITIPAEVFGLPNFIEYSGGDPNEPTTGNVFTVGDTMQFFAKKTWTDTFNSSDTLLSIKGLDRGSHTLRITKADANLTEVRLAQIFK